MIQMRLLLEQLSDNKRYLNLKKNALKSNLNIKIFYDNNLESKFYYYLITFICIFNIN